MKRNRRRVLSTGKRVSPTSLSLRIFRLLQHYYYLPTHHIHAHIGGNRLYLKWHLRDLTHEDNTPHRGPYLSRPAQQLRAPNFNNRPAYYEMTSRAYQYLKEAGAYDGHAYRITHLGRRSAHSEYSHEIFADELLSSLHLGAKRSAFDFIHASRILAQCDEDVRNAPSPFLFKLGERKHLTPDRMFGIKSDRSDYKFFALEADTGTKPISRSSSGSSIERQIDYYVEMMASKLYMSRLNLPSLLVLFVTNNETRKNSILQLIREKYTSLAWFLIKALPEYADPFRTPPPLAKLFSEPWHRAAGPDLVLGSL